MSINVSVNLNGLNFIIENFVQQVSTVMLGVATAYYGRVQRQFDSRPAYWQELAIPTVVYKRKLRKYGEPVKFRTPEQVLVNYGILRESIAVRPNQRRYITAPSGSRYPWAYNVGLFVGQAPRDRLRWAWVHEFGSSHFINKWRPGRLAMGRFRSFVQRVVNFYFKGMKALSISEADIAGKMNFERFYLASLKLAAKISKRIRKQRSKGDWVMIPRRSILREALNRFGPDFAAIVDGAMRAFFAAAQSLSQAAGTAAPLPPGMAPPSGGTPNIPYNPRP